MRERLYPNIRKITNVFSLMIVIVTVTLFLLRLTAFNDMAPEVVGPEPGPDSVVVDGTAFNYRIRDKITFPSPGGKGNITIENDSGNDFYMRLEIIYDISGKSVYVSPFLKPGNKIESGYLQGSPLASGEYGCTAVITAYDPQTRAELKNHRHPVTIIIESNAVSS